MTEKEQIKEEWPTCGACGNPIPMDFYGEPDDSGDGTSRGTCCWP